MHDQTNLCTDRTQQQIVLSQQILVSRESCKANIECSVHVSTGVVLYHVQKICIHLQTALDSSPIERGLIKHCHLCVHHKYTVHSAFNKAVIHG